jgi:hypothetical protein
MFLVFDWDKKDDVVKHLLASCKRIHFQLNTTVILAHFASSFIYNLLGRCRQIGQLYSQLESQCFSNFVQCETSWFVFLEEINFIIRPCHTEGKKYAPRWPLESLVLSFVMVASVVGAPLWSLHFQYAVGLNRFEFGPKAH